VISGNASGGPSTANQTGWNTIASALLLLVGTACVYSSVVHCPFIDYDDQFYITNNVILHEGLTWKVFKWSWTTVGYSQNWHPLSWLSHALDCQLFGLNPAGHHLTNLVFHLLNVVILFLVLHRLTGARGRSFLVAALFALHPLNVESVAWVAERKNVLSTFFFLLSLGAYGWYTAKPDVKRYLAMATLFALGLASKPMVITLPFVLLLLDFWPLDRVEQWSQRTDANRQQRKNLKERPGSHKGTFSVAPRPISQLFLEKFPLLALCGASAVLTIIAQRTVSIRSLERYPFSVRWENAVYAYATYIWKTFWPTRLAVYYPHPGYGLSVWQVGGAAAFLATLSIWVWKRRSAQRYLITGWLWYLGTLVPVIGLVQVGDQAMADRYAYIPLIGIFVMVVWTLADWADRRAIAMPWRAGIVTLILGLLSFLTWRQVRYWQSEIELWSHALEVTPGNTLALCNLGDAFQKMGRFEDGLPLHQQCAALYSTDPMVRGNLAIDLVQLERFPEAIQAYQTAISFASDALMRSHFYDSLAAVYDAQGNYAMVRDSYRQALQATPERAPEMIQWLSQSVVAQPSAPRYLQLGILQQECGKLSEAREAYDQAFNLDPSLGEAKAFRDALEAHPKSNPPILNSR